MQVSEHCATTESALCAQLVATIEDRVQQAVSARGIASLVVSGGNTPRPVFGMLSQRPLPWHRVQITLADERWVDTASKESNEAMLRDILLVNAAAAAHFVPLKNAAATAAQGQQQCHQALALLPRPFDLVILGMGEDGHTASLFPEVSGPALDHNTEALCLPIHPQHARHERMTLTARAILDSRHILLHILGDQKWKVYQQAKTEGPVDALPVRAILQQDRVPLDVYWSPA